MDQALIVGIYVYIFSFFFKGFFLGGWGGVTQPNFLLSRKIMSFFWGFNLMFEDIDLVC